MPNFFILSTISYAGFVFYVHFLDFVITTLLNNFTISNVGFVIDLHFLAFVPTPQLVSFIIRPDCSCYHCCSDIFTMLMF